MLTTLLVFTSPIFDGRNLYTTLWATLTYSSTTTYGNLFFILLLWLFLSKKPIKITSAFLLTIPLFLFVFNSFSLSCRLISFNLYNGAAAIHPYLVYLSYITAMSFTLYAYCIVTPSFFRLLRFLRILFLTISVGILLGGLWGATGIDWGAWWTWDMVEYSPLLIFFIFAYFLHYPRASLPLEFLFFILFLSLSVVVFLRMGFLLTKHSFFRDSRLFFDFSDLNSFNTSYPTILYFVLPPFFYFFTNKSKKITLSAAYYFIFFLTPFFFTLYLFVYSYTKFILNIFFFYFLLLLFKFFFNIKKNNFIVSLHAFFFIILALLYPYFLQYRNEIAVTKLGTTTTPYHFFFNANNRAGFLKSLNYEVYFSDTRLFLQILYNPWVSAIADESFTDFFRSKGLATVSFNQLDFYSTPNFFFNQARPSFFLDSCLCSYMSPSHYVTLDFTTYSLFFFFAILCILYVCFCV